MRTSGLFLLFVTILGQAPQTPPPTFRVEVNYVEVDARVTDSQGNFVRDLTQTDFEILEDGKPQAITAFTRVDLPVERHDPPLFKRAPIEPDTASNLDEFTGRVWILVLDDLQTRPLRTSLVQAAARQFIRRYVSANDLAAVVTTGGFGNATQDFTNSQARLVAAVDKFIGQKVPREVSDMERAFRVRNTYTTLRNVAEFVGAVRGRRKAVLWFGEGVDYNIMNPFVARDAENVRLMMQDVIAAANRQNVSFYGIDARGVGAGLDEVVEFSEMPDSSALRDEVRLSQDSLRVVSEQTGGFALVEKNDLNASFERIVRDNSSYYVLGYYSTNDKRDGKFHKLQVRVSRPGLRIQSREGYASPKGRQATAVNTQVAPEVREAFANPIPSSAVGLTISTAAFSGPGSKASVALIAEVDPRSIKFLEQNGRSLGGIELHVLAFDQNGKMQTGGRTSAPLQLTPRTADLVRSHGLRLTRRLVLPPGRYLIRAAARETTSGTVGTVSHNFDVPDFTKGPLHLSGIVLTTQSAAQMPTPAPDDDLKVVLPAPPTALRIFLRGDTLSLFAEVYDNQNSTPHRVAITSTVLADDGRVMFTASDERASSELQGKKGGYGYQQVIPLAQFAPGRYVLRLEAKNLASRDLAVARELEFRVR
jgi:VWFA-related protein